MTLDRWRRIEQLYHDALARAPEGRREFLADACAGDSALHREVASLLDHAAASGVLDGSAPGLEDVAPFAPASMTGRPFATFDVKELVGVGGMGEVYRARDTRLGRDVALKFLPVGLQSDPERVARFEREARVLARLNHPNIASIHGVERAEGTMALVMEWVDGDDLSRRRRPGVDDALSVARQIADALEAAHEQSVVHRDLKPANVKVRPDGTVKVLDFGLASVLAPSALEGPEQIIKTQPGAILGTPSYMSPEQVRGETVDRQADIWAFGVVLYELLTGVSPFARPTSAETIAAVLREPPDETRLPHATPARVRHLIRRCLERDRRRRLQHIGDARLELEDALAPSSADAGAETAGRPQRRWLIIAVALAAGASVLLAAWLARVGPSQPPPEPTVFAVHPPDGNAFRTPVLTGYAAPVGGTISPDGRTLAFTASDAAGRILLWVRPLRQRTARALPGTDGAALPFWSPDSRSLGFFAGGKLKRIDVENGASQDLSNIGRARGGAWSSGGIILFAGGLEMALSQIDATGGTAKPATTLLRGHRSHRFPSFLPGERRFLYYVDGDTPEDTGVFVGDLGGGRPQRILAADTAALYSATSEQLLFVRQTTLFAQAFDVETLRLSGDPVPLVDGVPREGTAPAFSVSSAAGTLTYRTEAVAQQQQLAWIDRRGNVGDLVGPPGSYRGIDLSPVGARVAVHRHDDNGGDVWVIEPSGTMTRVTFNAIDDNSSPVWDPTGTRIAFAARRNGRWGVYQKPADGTDTDERLIDSGNPVSPASWSSDGANLVYWLFTRSSPDQYQLRLSDRHVAPLIQSRFAETHGQISPDGRWLAYAANTTGRLEVYVRPFLTGDTVYQVSKGGGAMPRWRSDSRELFYATSYDRSKLMTVAVRSAGADFVAGPPHELFDTGMVLFPHSLDIPTYHSYAVARDGQRFLLPRPVSQFQSGADSPITVVLHWTGLIQR